MGETGVSCGELTTGDKGGPQLKQRCLGRRDRKVKSSLRLKYVIITLEHARGCVVVASPPEVERVSGSTSSARVLFMQLRHRLDAPEGADGLA